MPRIRTIKPEFWRNRQLANLSAFTRLVAIALLNVADDEGYFEADPALIRGDVFPYEHDYGSITVALRELSEIGYVAFRACPEKGEIGHIPNFKKHQVINKPGRSKLKEIYENSKEILQFSDDYGSTTGVLPDDYRLEQGTGNREQGNGMEHDFCSELKAAEQEELDDRYVFPVKGGSRQWKCPKRLVRRLDETYDNIDVHFQIRAAMLWIESKPERTKTAKGMPAFLNGWVARAVNNPKSPKRKRQLTEEELNDPILRAWNE